MMHEIFVTLFAPPDHSLNVWFEPWAEGVTISAGVMIVLRASAPNQGRLEIDHQKQGVVIYGWPGCTLKVIVDGEMARDFNVPFPDLPSGMDMKNFIGLLFGPPPTSGGAPEKHSVKRPWWRFWGE